VGEPAVLVAGGQGVLARAGGSQVNQFIQTYNEAPARPEAAPGVVLRAGDVPREPPGYRPGTTSLLS
jgi:hypothetical protein